MQRNRLLRVSVILSTFEDTACLEKAVWGYFKQSCQDFELLVADDGQGPDPADCLRGLRRETGLTIRHLRARSPDARKCAALNRAIQQAEGAYLIFSEDRCIPRWDFVEVHVRLARPGRYLAGACVQVHTQLSRSIDREEVISGHATDAQWLRCRGLQDERRTRILSAQSQWAGLWDLFSGMRVAWNSANASCWKDDLLEVNGFDERIQCGALDRELGERLSNAGIRGKNVQYRAVCIRLQSQPQCFTRETLERNLTLSDESRRTRATWTPFGIRKGYRVLGVEGTVQPAIEGERSRRAVA